MKKLRMNINHEHSYPLLTFYKNKFVNVMLEYLQMKITSYYRKQKAEKSKRLSSHVLFCFTFAMQYDVTKAKCLPPAMTYC